MIIILDERYEKYHVMIGDTFVLSYTRTVDNKEILRKDILREPIQKCEIIDYWAIFVFTDNKGNTYTPNIVGFIGKQDNLPLEIKNAKRIKDLTPEQYNNLQQTALIKC